MISTYSTLKTAASLRDGGVAVQVLCPEPLFSLARLTASVTAGGLPPVPIGFVLPAKADLDECRRISGLGKVVYGGDTITSLMNAAIASSPNPWCLMVMCGGRVTMHSFKTYLGFCHDDRDILFSAVDRQVYFPTGSISGLMVHRDALGEVGPFPDRVDDLVSAKLEWAGRAIDRGYRFKTVVGTKFV